MRLRGVGHFMRNFAIDSWRGYRRLPIAVCPVGPEGGAPTTDPVLVDELEDRDDNDGMAVRRH